MTIQDVGSVAPGEERREIEFVLAWHEDDPVVGRWDIDYDFEVGGRWERNCPRDGQCPLGDRSHRRRVPAGRHLRRQGVGRRLEEPLS